MMCAPGDAAVTALWIVEYCAFGHVAGFPTTRFPLLEGGSTSDWVVGPTFAKSVALKPSVDQSTVNLYRSSGGAMRWTSREVATGAPSIGEIVWAGAEADQSASKAAARPTSARALLAGRAIRFMVVLLMVVLLANSRGRSSATPLMRKTAIARFIFRLL